MKKGQKMLIMGMLAGIAVLVFVPSVYVMIASKINPSSVTENG